MSGTRSGTGTWEGPGPMSDKLHGMTGGSAFPHRCRLPIEFFRENMVGKKFLKAEKTQFVENTDPRGGSSAELRYPPKTKTSK